LDNAGELFHKMLWHFGCSIASIALHFRASPNTRSCAAKHEKRDLEAHQTPVEASIFCVILTTIYA